MKAVVLVAGVSRRLYPLTEYRPKCLLDLGGRCIFDHQMDALRSVGVREVCLVVGYRREQIQQHAETHHPDLRFSYRINHHFFETNTTHSLFLAGEEFLDRDAIYMNGDVLFEPRLLQKVVDSPHRAALAVEIKRCGDEEVKVITDDDGRILEIGKELDHDASLGEFIGVARFNAPFNPYLFKAMQQLVAEDDRDAYFEKGLARMAAKHAFHAVDVTEMPCIEVDFPEDYERARAEILTRFAKR